MAHDVALAERVRRVLAEHPDIVEKRMVGGLSFSIGGRMCCGVTGKAVMIRVGPEARDAFLELPFVRPMVLGGRRTAGFVLVDPEGVATDESLAAWVQRALALVNPPVVNPPLPSSSNS